MQIHIKTIEALSTPALPPMMIKVICVCCPPHLDEEAGPEVCPGLGPAEGPVAGQVSPLDGERSVGRAHQQHPCCEAQRLGGAEQEEGCRTTPHISSNGLI